MKTGQEAWHNKSRAEQSRADISCGGATSYPGWIISPAGPGPLHCRHGSLRNIPATNAAVRLKSLMLDTIGDAASLFSSAEKMGRTSAYTGLGFVQLCGLPPLLLQKNAPCSTECGAQYEAKRNETVPTLVIIYDSTAISELEP